MHAFENAVLFSQVIGKSAAMRVGTMNGDRIVVLRVPSASDCIQVHCVHTIWLYVEMLIKLK